MNGRQLFILYVDYSKTFYNIQKYVKNNKVFNYLTPLLWEDKEVKHFYYIFILAVNFLKFCISYIVSVTALKSVSIIETNSSSKCT